MYLRLPTLLLHKQWWEYWGIPTTCVRVCGYVKTNKPLCSPGWDLSHIDTRFFLSRGSCAASKAGSTMGVLCCMGAGGHAQQLKPRKMVPGMHHSSCYCWLIGIWELGKVILNAKNGTLKKQLLVLSSEWPRQQKALPLWRGNKI